LHGGLPLAGHICDGVRALVQEDVEAMYLGHIGVSTGLWKVKDVHASHNARRP
jgi:hypothetical protein